MADRKVARNAPAPSGPPSSKAWITALPTTTPSATSLTQRRLFGRGDPETHGHRKLDDFAESPHLFLQIFGQGFTGPGHSRPGDVIEESLSGLPDRQSTLRSGRWSDQADQVQGRSEDGVLDLRVGARSGHR